MPKTVRRVALLFERVAGYQCQVLIGIHQHVRESNRWRCFGLSPNLAILPELRSLHIDGVLGIVNTPDVTNELLILKCPIVNVSNFITCPRISRVGVDEFAVGKLAAEHLLDRGLRHFAYVPHSTGVFSRERQAGYFTTLEEAGIPDRHITVYEKGLTSRFWQGSDDKSLERWLAELPHPVGLFAANDALAMKVIEEAHRAGRRMPDDLAIIGVDNSELHTELLRPRLTSIEQPTARIGLEAAALLDQLMQGEPAPTRPLLLKPVRIHSRESTDSLAIPDHTLAKAIQYLRAHATEDLRIQDIIAQTGWSRRKFEDRFRLQLHRSPHEEITRVRFEKAKHLLLSTQLPLADIAKDSGFATTSRLSQAFQKQLKTSPGKFRLTGKH